MNILISVWSLTIGGAEVFAVNLAEELKKRGHCVYIFNTNESLVDNELIRRLDENNTKVLSMSKHRIINFISWKLNALFNIIGFSFSFHKEIKKLLLKYYIIRFNIEIVSSHSVYSDQLCVSVLKNKNRPLVITEHGEYSMYINQGNKNLIRKLNNVNAIITVSNYCKNILTSYQIQNSIQIETIYNGVQYQQPAYNNSARSHLRISKDDFVFGLVARGIPEKGWKQAIEAFQLAEKDISKKMHLILVGGSIYLDELKRIYSNAHNIHFVGKTAEPNFYIEAFDIGLLPSYFAAESLSLATIEYLLQNKPAIVTNWGGIPETIRYGDKWAGSLIEITTQGLPDIIQLKNVMLSYICNPELYKQHMSHTYLVRERFSMDKCVENYEAIFIQLVKHKYYLKGAQYASSIDRHYQL